jgi:hypothetical protein
LVERALIEQSRLGSRRKSVEIQAGGLFPSRVRSGDIGRRLRPAFHPAGEQLAGCGKSRVLLLLLITMQIL